MTQLPLIIGFPQILIVLPSTMNMRLCLLNLAHNLRGGLTARGPSRVLFTGYRRLERVDSLAKRKRSKPEPTLFDGVNPAVRVHALLGALYFFARCFSRFSKYFFASLLTHG
jgi:hypothetical protein